jgi:nucleoside-diphosphate-sugar epimerase
VTPTKLIVGCGYLGLRVGRRWRDAGQGVVAMTRSESRAAELVAEDLGTMTADVTRRNSMAELSSSAAGHQLESALYAVGFDRESGVDILSVYAGGLQNVLAALPSSVRRVIYISTTGVYGPHSGQWVDELTPPDPQRDGGRASLAAEQILAAHPLGRRSAILRLAGLYGPGRVPHLDKLRAGEPLPVPSDGWLNLIHVDDAARIVVAADAWLARRETADGPHVFCVADGSPVRRDDYYREAARVLGAAPPQFIVPPLDSPAVARAGANRRIRNGKMRDTFGVALEFPTYRQGLAAILAAS